MALAWATFALCLVSVSAFSLHQRSRRQTASAALGCEFTSWAVNGNFEYGASTNREDFATARAKCAACGAYLASVDSAAENSYIRNLFLNGDSVYIGLNDQAVEKTFVWLDGSSPQYTNWRGGEPDDVDTDKSTLNADCAYITGNGVWRDLACDSKRAYVCKKRIIVPTTTSPAPAVEVVPTTTSPAPAVEVVPTTTSPAPAVEVVPTTTSPIPAVEVVPTTTTPAPTVEVVPTTTSAPEINVVPTTSPTPVDEVLPTVYNVNETPAPQTPAPETPAPETPAPETPAPVTSAPETSAPVTSAPETTTVDSGYRRTVVLLEKWTVPGQNVFFRGGLDHGRTDGCTNYASTSKCAIPITYRNMSPLSETHRLLFNAWSQNDRFLDWYGAESEQNTYNGKQAEGTPAVWTTNAQSNNGYYPINTFGPHYWVMDVDMDCTKTKAGYFEIKGFLSGAWETGNNHRAKCGALNVFHWERDTYEVRDIA